MPSFLAILLGNNWKGQSCSRKRSKSVSAGDSWHRFPWGWGGGGDTQISTALRGEGVLASICPRPRKCGVKPERGGEAYQTHTLHGGILRSAVGHQLSFPHESPAPPPNGPSSRWPKTSYYKALTPPLIKHTHIHTQHTSFKC